MQQISATPPGRRAKIYGTGPETQTPDSPAPHDKWAVFADLRQARRAYGLTDRDLVVLNALISFLPERDLDETELVVFPSNARLGERAHGMAESTLRRHLAALVAAGLIRRHDSPNGKRYAHRTGAGAILRAFGFSLEPLARRAGEIRAAADRQRAEAITLRLMRETLVLTLREAALLLTPPTEALPHHQMDPAAQQAFQAGLAHLRLCLRRKMDAAHLEPLLKSAITLLAEIRQMTAPSPAPEYAAETASKAADTPATQGSETADMGGNDRQNERHIQESIPDSPDSDPAGEQGAGGNVAPLRISLAQVLRACPDLSVFSSKPIRDWADLTMVTRELHPMLGVSPEVWQEAEELMGPQVTALSLATMVQRIRHIRNPGGYLRSLARKAAQGGYSPLPMLFSLLSATASRPAPSGA